MPQPSAPDPPGYYAGWPLANVGKRLGAAVIDYPVLWFGLIMAVSFVSNVVAAVSTEGLGSAAGAWAVFVAWAIIVWNGDFRQGRSGQSFGKQIMGLRTVDMTNLGPPGRLSCMSRSLGLLFDVGLFGVGILLIAFSDQRRSFGDRFGGTVVLDERRAGATIAWAVPGERAEELAPPEPQCAVRGWQPPSAWRRWKEWKEGASGTGSAQDFSAQQTNAPRQATVIGAEKESRDSPAEPALPGLDEDELDEDQVEAGLVSEAPPASAHPSVPVPDEDEADAGPVSDASPSPEHPLPYVPMDAELPPLGAGGPLCVELDEIAEGRRRLLDARLACLAHSKGLPEPRRFVTEEIVGAVEAGDLDEAFLFAGRQARAYIRAFHTPNVRHRVVQEMTEDFDRLVRIFGAGEVPEAAQIRRRFGLQSVWESTGGDEATGDEAEPDEAGPPPSAARWAPLDDSYFADVAGAIKASLDAGETGHADELARKTISELFAAGEPVSVEAAVEDYRDLLSHYLRPTSAAHGDLDDDSLARRLGLLNSAS
jgi:uncharacterized RDD family membrane protein YckC